MKITVSVFRSLPRLFVLAILAVTAAGCGGDDNACVKAAKTICAAACACGGSGRCAIGDSSSSITFSNESGCVTLYSLGCPNGDGSIDFAACQSALSSPVCVQSSDGPALDLPAACE
jgi:hypothetical protein